MSYVSAIYQQSPYIGNFGQITQATVTGVPSSTTSTQYTVSVIGYGPGTYLITFNYSMYNPSSNDIGTITFSFGGGNQIVYRAPVLFPTTAGATNINNFTSIGGCVSFPSQVNVPYNVAVSASVTFVRGTSGPFIDAGIPQFNNFQAIKIC